MSPPRETPKRVPLMTHHVRVGRQTRMCFSLDRRKRAGGGGARRPRVRGTFEVLGRQSVREEARERHGWFMCMTSVGHHDLRKQSPWESRIHRFTEHMYCRSGVVVPITDKTQGRTLRRLEAQPEGDICGTEVSVSPRWDACVGLRICTALRIDHIATLRPPRTVSERLVTKVRSFAGRVLRHEAAKAWLRKGIKSL